MAKSHTAVLTPKRREVINRYLNKYPYAKFKDLIMLLQTETVEFKPTCFDSMKRLIKQVRNENGSKQQNTDISILDSEEIMIPETMYRDIPPFIIPDNIERILCLFDIHAPYHDVSAVKVAIKFGRDYGIDAVFLGGDFMDEYAESRFLNDPNFRDTNVELDAGRKFLKDFRKIFPDIKLYYKVGNHDDRLELRIMDIHPSMHNVQDIKIESLLKFDDLGIEKIGSLQMSVFGKLNLFHGHEFRRGGIHIAYNNLLKNMENTMCGHFHRTNEYIHRTIADDIKGSWSVGCLCGLKPAYMPINNWNHGCAMVERTDTNGNFIVHNKKIINGVIR